MINDSRAIPGGKNIADTEAYRRYRSGYESVFQQCFRSGEPAVYPLPDRRHILETDSYEYPHHHPFRMPACKIRVMAEGRTVAEFTTVGRDGILSAFAAHGSGRSYLLYSMDLYGYSVMDLGTYHSFHYIPEECLEGRETFIWTNALYCGLNHLLAVDGCIWGAPYSTEVFDFSRPESLPYPRVFSSLDLREELSADDDVIPVGWTRDGGLILRGHTLDGSEQGDKIVYLRT